MSISKENIIQQQFYLDKNSIQVARNLLGKVLYTSINKQVTAGIITETEAYEGVNDRASHAFNNRLTNRTKIMYKEGGHAYIYLCYGVHSLFNVVTSVEGDPKAVLIRAIEPLIGIETMQSRAAQLANRKLNGTGPGNVTRLLGIHYSMSGLTLKPTSNSEDAIWITDKEIHVPESEIITGPRVGVDYAGADALLPYRFRWIKKAP